MEQVKNITVAKLFEICEENRYLLLRYRDGRVVGLNCGLKNLAKRRNVLKPTDYTKFVSFRSCSLNEYINHKCPFVVV